MSSTPEFNETQLGAARAAAWKQAGERLLTLEAVRDWINERGLVLFAPRAQQLPAPAPSLVEATMGKASAAPAPAEIEAARELVSRLVGEGLALPLNLLGGSSVAGAPGDSPDFVVSAQVFSYIFTMRGDKAWKQPPSTSGAVKVSPLGLRVFEVLTERGPMSAAELAQELGREVTETAILRSLSELWSQLRVIPLLTQGEGSRLWELTSRRFTKAIKAGANAGQPTALSALVSLYLAQVFVATEEEVVTFLSPLTARSRVREVLHALVGARQLDTVVLEGRTLLHIPGTLPAFAAAADEDATAEEGDVIAPERPKKVGTGRIKSFSSDGKTAGEFRGKPVARSFSAGRAKVGRAKVGPVKPSARFGARLDGKNDRERRPFKKAGAAGAAKKPSFSKPWTEERKARPAAKPDGFTKFRRPSPEDREPLGPREQAGLPMERRSAPKTNSDRASKPTGLAKRPYAPRRAESEERGPFKPRSFERGASERPGRRASERAGERTSERVGGGRDRKPKRPYTPRTTEREERTFAKRPSTPRTTEGGERGSFKPRSFERQDSEHGAKRGATLRGFAAKRPYAPRTAERGESGFAKRPYTPHVTETSGERTLPKRPYKPRAADADKRPFTKVPWVPKTESDGAKRPYKPRGEGSFGRSGSGSRKGFGSKPAGEFGGKPEGKSGSRPSGRFGKTSGSGAKRADSKRSGVASGAGPAKHKKPRAEE